MSGGAAHGGRDCGWATARGGRRPGGLGDGAGRQHADRMAARRWNGSAVVRWRLDGGVVVGRRLDGGNSRRRQWRGEGGSCNCDDTGMRQGVMQWQRQWR